ncbi:TetR family transcriptional regulator C-terminal domain-containing protein [Paenibacillus alba]|uniref:Tetracyclin repressor-like C-terminal domain-containing protein n=1 Tax=Paenibacillus alba TaxID=1197127 RepID=A0ABU6G6B4_9BACL|nr:hypothetical protein [Paenibacillus alba]MEC0229184.1 hypothetical protein [Paenibacillus alba]
MKKGDRTREHIIMCRQQSTIYWRMSHAEYGCRSDDTHSELRDRARQGLHTVLDMMKIIIREGIKSGEFRGDLDSDALASFAFSLLEGGILLSKLDRDNKHMQKNTLSLISLFEKQVLSNLLVRWGR